MRACAFFASALEVLFMNYSRAVGIARFVLVILIIALVMSLAVFGFKPWGLGGVFEEGTVTLGLDLQGGSVITYRAVPAEGEAIDSAGMASINNVMRTRLDSDGLLEATTYLVGDDMIAIEIPGDSDPTGAVEKYGAAGKLTFGMWDPTTEDYDKIVMSGEYVASAFAKTSSETGIFVELNLTAEGAQKFAEVTKNVAALSSQSHNLLVIYMDDKVVSSPRVNEQIDSQTCVITHEGGFESDEANYLANVINAGSLKYDLELASTRSVGPKLGEKSLSTSLRAGAIGIALVVIFMICVYRIPGLMASIALAAYTAIFMLLLALLHTNLTLPGIAGIVLSIGMAVDANCIIFERMKEEIRAGKSAKAAIKEGFSKAFSAILDSNVTTFIAAAVLYILGSGTIRGFAVTLGLGVIISFFTALVVTRVLLYLGCAMGLTNIKLYGVSERSAE